MKRKLLKAMGLSCMLALAGTATAQQVYDLKMDTRKVGAPIQSTMYGLFFEDINFAADGGLYAEMVKNRSFDFPQQLLGWYTFGNVELSTADAPFDKNPHYVILRAASHAHKHTGIENEGFRGMGFKANEEYRFSVWAKNMDAREQVIRVELIDPSYNVLAKEKLTITSADWKKHEIRITPKSAEAKGRIRIFLESEGPLALDHVSLFPADTYKGRENGLRKDLAQALADIHPGVFRFPGGCIVEGTEIDDRYDWKKSVGAVENRPLNKNRWEYTFQNRYFPDYYQSYGLGFYEYFLLSEDMGAEPLPVVNCGLVCQYQNEKEECHVPVGNLDTFIQDALDLIEFANGATTTKWGALRAQMGHPAPFNLKLIGVGNEQWGESYTKRLEPFVKAIKAKYPEIKVIGSSGPSADGKEFDYLWPEMKRLKVDLVDEHYYKDPDWFLNSAARYDNYDRKGPAVFAGEYACHIPKAKSNNFESALCEAAFMTGLERNADIVHMCTYAPLFAHVEAWQWRPDMIWFDNQRMMKTPNYYVQQIYAQNAGTNVMKLTLADGKTPATGQNGLYASAVLDKKQNCYIVKIVNTSAEAKDIRVTLAGAKKKMAYTIGDCIKYQSNDIKQENSLNTPDNIVPRYKNTATMNGDVLEAKADGYSFNVYRIKL